jgi:DNA-binding HxlR family transcriptional regulator
VGVGWHNAQILSKELRELELNEFVERKILSTTPVTVQYSLTSYSQSLEKALTELRNWGLQHRERIRASRKVNTPESLKT